MHGDVGRSAAAVLTAALFVPHAVVHRAAPKAERPAAQGHGSDRGHDRLPQDAAEAAAEADRADADDVKPEGVSRDENKKPSTTKKDEKKPDDRRPTPNDPFAQVQRARRRRQPGKPTTEPSATSTAARRASRRRARATRSSARLRGDMNFHVPGDRQGSEHPRSAAFTSNADGKIADTTFDRRSDNRATTICRRPPKPR